MKGDKTMNNGLAFISYTLKERDISLAAFY